MKNGLLFFTMLTFFSLDATSQNLSADLQVQIAALGDGESFDMKYVKKGCWGTYEGGGITFTLQTDSVLVTMTNQQNYLGAEAQTTTSKYHVDDLLQTLEENKRSFSMDDNNIVLANSFEYRLEQDAQEIAAGSAALEPADVIYKVALSNSLRDSFLGKKKGLIKHSGVIKGSGINN